MTNSRDTRNWYQKKRWIFIWLIFFPPLGLILLWITRWSRWAKTVGTSISIFFLIVGLGGTLPEQPPEVTSSPPPETVSSLRVEVDPPTPTPEPAPEAFREAINYATEAVNLGQTAQTTDDWEAAANLWQQAVDSLGQVPENSSYFQTAQAKITEYGANRETAQQQAERIRQEAIAAEQERQRQEAARAQPQPGSPIRAAASGSCDCPYDTDSAGRRCGGRSAYSRPGGRDPICYVDD